MMVGFFFFFFFFFQIHLFSFYSRKNPSRTGAGRVLKTESPILIAYGEFTRSIAQAVAELNSSKVLNEERLGQVRSIEQTLDNPNFFRPLFIALVASPVLLLDSRSWGGGKRKIGISKFSDVSARFSQFDRYSQALQSFILPTATLDEERLLIDVELWTIIMQLCAGGAARLEANLRQASSRWGMFGDQESGTNECRFVISSRQDWNKQLGENRKSSKSMRRRSIVSDRLRWYQVEQGGHISQNLAGESWFDRLCDYEDRCEFDRPSSVNLSDFSPLFPSFSAAVREFRCRVGASAGIQFSADCYSDTEMDDENEDDENPPRSAPETGLGLRAGGDNAASAQETESESI